MLNQFASLSLKDQSAMLKALREAHKQARADYKNGRAALKAEKAALKAEKQAAAIVKAQARLQRLLEKQAAPVGIKAAKANRKPGKVVTYGAEANADAARIMAKKAKA